jgi:hypothetical protein
LTKQFEDYEMPEAFPDRKCYSGILQILYEFLREYIDHHTSLEV